MVRNWELETACRTHRWAQRQLSPFHTFFKTSNDPLLFSDLTDLTINRLNLANLMISVKNDLKIKRFNY